MSNSPLLNVKLPYVDNNNSSDDVLNHVVKTLNSTFRSPNIIGDNFPVGTFIESMLTEDAFQSQMGTGWVLADGRTVNKSKFKELTGLSVIPDCRGRVLRGKSYSSGNNPDGDLALGTYQADMYASHSHSALAGSVLDGSTYPTKASASNSGGPGTGSSGGNETRMKNITVNIFIKIN